MTDLADFEREHAEEIETEFMRRFFKKYPKYIEFLKFQNTELYNEVLSDLADEHGVSD